MLAELAGGWVHRELKVWGMGADMGLQQRRQGLSPCPRLPSHLLPVPSSHSARQSYPQWKKVLHPAQALNLWEKNKVNKLHGMEASHAFLCPLVTEWVSGESTGMDERDQFSISMSQGLWYKLGPVVYYFFRRDRTEKMSQRKGCWVPFMYGIYTHALTYLYVWM